MKTKKASTILALALAVTIALVPSMMVSAASTPDIGVIDAPVVQGASTIQFQVNYTMTATESDQVTILVTKGSQAITYADTSNTQPNNIVYIDQTAYKSDASYFSFAVDMPTANETYYVKIGGTGIDSPDSETKVIEISSGNITVPQENITVAAQDNVYGVTGAKLVTVNITNLIPSTTVESDYKVTVKGTELRYNPKNKKFYGAPIVGAAGVVPTDVDVTKGTRAVSDIIFGNADGDASGAINGLDITFMKYKIAENTIIPNGDLSADVNLDGSVNGLDITFLKFKIAENSAFPADQ